MHDQPDAIGTRAVIVLLMVAAMVIGAWELAITRLASVVYFYDLTYLVLAVCLFALALGALAARSIALRPGLLLPMVMLILPLPVFWWFLIHFDAAWIGGVFSLPFLLFGAISTFAWHRLEHGRARVFLYAGELLGTVVGLLILGPAVISVLPVAVLADMGIHSHLKDTVTKEGLVSHEHTTTAYARTDFVRTQRESVAYVFTDAMFVTRAVRWDGGAALFTDPEVERLASLKRLALRTGDRERLLILGAGAGFDMAIALQEGAAQIDAVEVNPQTIAYGESVDDWAGNIFSNSRVRVHVAEARRFLVASTAQWDHIGLTLMQTSPATGRGLSHIDARVLTLEAVRDYLTHLRPSGVLAVIQNSQMLAEQTWLTVLAACESDAQRTLVFRMKNAEGNPFSYLVVARNEAFSVLERANLASAARVVGAQLVDMNWLLKMGASSRLNSHRLATDNRPFMFEPDQRMSTISILVVAFAGLILLIVLARERKCQRNIRLGVAGALTGAIALIIQVLVIYRMQAALGNPALAMGVSLAAVLGGAGLGAILLGGRVVPLSSWRFSAVLSAIGLVCFAVLSPFVIAASIGLEVAAAACAMGLFTALCCAPVGLMFLTVMHHAGSVRDSGRGKNEGLVIGCDGIGGVIGAAGATGIAMSHGFNMLGVVLLLCCFAFALARPAVLVSQA
jgi:spermidine synthase